VFGWAESGLCQSHPEAFVIAEKRHFAGLFR
jgi:hypothetical protein